MGLDAIGVSALIGLAAIIGPFISRQAQSEFQDWTPKVVTWLIEHAVQRLPENKRERFREEWAAHLGDTPGEVGKWVVAAGCLLAARRMTPRQSILVIQAKSFLQTLRQSFSDYINRYNEKMRARAVQMSIESNLLREELLIRLDEGKRLNRESIARADEIAMEYKAFRASRKKRRH